MTRGTSEVTDEHGVTHHIQGNVRFIRLPKKRRRRNPAKQGHYVTKDDCSWWCTGEPIPANTPATPGRTVDCMTCLVDPPTRPEPLSSRDTVTGWSLRNGTRIMASTPSGRPTQIFDVKTRSTRSITIGRRAGKRR